jgi:hypothetical protein
MRYPVLISVWLWNLKDFCLRINMLKGKNRTLKVDFLCQKLSKSFQKHFSLKNINLGHQLL